MVVYYLFDTMWCDDKFRMCDDKFRTKSFCRCPFFIMHVIIFDISFHAWWIVFISRRGAPQVQPAMCICIQKQNTYMHIFRGSLPATYEDNTLILTFHILLSPLKKFNQFVINHQKGEIVSASSATPSWFWSIDDKPGWGTNVFVRIAG